MPRAPSSILVASLLAGLGTPPADAARNVIHYNCPGKQELTVQRDAQRAQVSLDGRTYDLQRKRSSIGDKYLSARAALIIDGPSAVFVAENRFELGTCIRSSSVASYGALARGPVPLTDVQERRRAGPGLF